MTEITFEYSPLPIHADFHRSLAYERFLFGAFGSGKTYAICAEAIAWCLEQPGIRGLVTRRTVPELRDTTETVFFEVLPPELYKMGEVRRMGGHVESFLFPNGSKVLFRSIDDWNKHKSLNVGFIAWDECDEFDDETYQGMLSRIRQRDPTPEGKEYGATMITRRGSWAASNPAGHNWLYKRAVDESTKLGSTEYWRSTSFDNPHLPPEYLDSLLQYPELWIRRYVLCQFDDFAGQIYENWNWDDHVVEPLKDYTPDSVHWMGFDPGTRAPTAGLWVVMNPADRTLTAISEYQEPGLDVPDHAMNFRRIEAQKRMRMKWRCADPTITTRDRGTNMKLSDQYARLGFYFDLGPKRPVDRIPMLGTLIRLNRFKVTKECLQTYEAIKDYQWEELTPHQRAKGEDPKEQPLKKNTHLVECAQYVSSRWVAPPPRPAHPVDESFSEEAQRLIKKQLAFKRLGPPINHDLGGVHL